MTNTATQTSNGMETLVGLAAFAAMAYFVGYWLFTDTKIDVRDEAALGRLHNDQTIELSDPATMCHYAVAITLHCETVPAGEKVIVFSPAFTWKKDHSSDGDGKIEGKHAFLRAPFTPNRDNIWLADPSAH